MHMSSIDSTYQTCYHLATEINLIIIKYFCCRMAFFNKKGSEITIIIKFKVHNRPVPGVSRGYLK